MKVTKLLVLKGPVAESGDLEVFNDCLFPLSSCMNSGTPDQFLLHASGLAVPGPASCLKCTIHQYGVVFARMSHGCWF